MGGVTYGVIIRVGNEPAGMMDGTLIMVEITNQNEICFRC